MISQSVNAPSLDGQALTVKKKEYRVNRSVTSPFQRFKLPACLPVPGPVIASARMGMHAASLPVGHEDASFTPFSSSPSKTQWIIVSSSPPGETNFPYHYARPSPPPRTTHPDPNAERESDATYWREPRDQEVLESGTQLQALPW